MSSKSAAKAKQTQNTVADKNTKVDAPQKDCPLSKHFFKIAVQDSKGNPISAFKPKVELNDGTVLAAVPLTGAGKYDSGKILDAATPCKVSFPDLYDAEWWPEGQRPKGFSVNQQITIADGDCVSKAAKDAGFQDYLTIWDRSKNKTLKTKHPNPNALVVGDILWAPDEKTRVVEKAVDQEWKFIIDAETKPKLRIILVDKEKKALEDWEWEITGVDTQKGKTAADGLIEIDPLDPTVTAGTLKLKIKRPPTPITPPASLPPLTNPPPYPPPIVTTDFNDKEPDKPTQTDVFEWTLKIGSLPSHKEKTGTLARLRNLGYSCDVDSADDKITPVVKAYQKAVMKNDTPSGNHADIQQPVEDHHSKA